MSKSHDAPSEERAPERADSVGGGRMEQALFYAFIVTIAVSIALALLYALGV